MKTKISLKLLYTLLIYCFSNSISAKITVVNYTCAEDKPLTVSYFLGNATKNATTIFNDNPHKMYYDPTSTQVVMVFREEPYSLHVENKNDITTATLINVVKESQGKNLHDAVLYKQCVPD